MTNELIVGIVLLVVCIGLGLLFSEANHWRKRKQAQIESASNTSMEDREDTRGTANDSEPPSGNDPPGDG